MGICVFGLHEFEIQLGLLIPKIISNLRQPNCDCRVASIVHDQIVRGLGCAVTGQNPASAMHSCAPVIGDDRIVEDENRALNKNLEKYAYYAAF